MPIKPENRTLYPGGSPTSPEWKALRAEILDRASNNCERCGIANGAIIHRSEDGKSYYIEDEIGSGIGVMRCSDTSDVLKEGVVWYDATYDPDRNPVVIVLTIAHIDQDPTNNDHENLAALCQRCHNRLDAPHRAKNAAKTRHAKKASDDFFGYGDKRKAPVSGGSPDALD